MKAATILTFFSCFACFGQAAGPSFEVASIRPTSGLAPTDACQRRLDCVETTPQSLTIRNESLRAILRWAYDLPPVQIEAPEWLAQNPFDIVAKTASPTDETQLRLMLQRLLVDRFGVKVHEEKRTMQGYAITLAKGGPKFQESETAGSFVLERNSPVVLNAHHARMLDLAEGIAGELAIPVVDATGLTGRYEIHLDLSAYLTGAAGGNGGQLDMMSILFTGFQDLLGLKLEARKVTVGMLIVDHAEKMPTEN